MKPPTIEQLRAGRSTMNPDPFEYIRNHYGVPAKKGQRVEVAHNGTLKQGTITGARNQYIKITFDGEKKPAGVFHPTDGIRYLTEADAVRAAFDAMEDEQKAEFLDYVKRCGGAPISTIQ